MAALFAVAVAVQYNDPHPVLWMAIYGAACAVSIVAAWRGSVPVAAPVTVGIIAFIWALDWAATSYVGIGIYSHMFDAWEMKSSSIEEAREATGLLIVAVWMAVVAARSRAGAGSGQVRAKQAS